MILQSDLCSMILDHLTPRTLGLLSCTCKSLENKVNAAWTKQAELIFGLDWHEITRLTEVVHRDQVFRVPRTAKEIVRLETEDSTRIYGWESWIERDLAEGRRRVVDDPTARKQELEFTF